MLFNTIFYKEFVMDKKKYDVTIAGVEMSIISDEREEFVQKLVSKLDKQITDITIQNKRCSKLDAGTGSQQRKGESGEKSTQSRGADRPLRR